MTTIDHQTIRGGAMLRNVTRCISLLVAVLLLGGTSAFATTQTNYSVAPITGVYTEALGGTLHASGATLDNQVVSSVALGFSFTVGTVVYTTVNVHANGYLTFSGTGFAGTTYMPLTSAETANAVVAAWAADLVGRTTGELRTVLLGAPGSYTFVAQWKDMTRKNTFGSDGIYNFQIRLNQANNSIDMVYGSMVVAGPYAAQIGMRGVGAADAYSIRADYDRNTWANPSIRTSASFATAETGFVPVSGRTYRWLRRVAPGSNNDAGVLNVGTVVANYNANVQQTVFARVKNWGTSNLDSVIIEWRVNGVNRLAVKYYPQPALAPNAEADVNLGFEAFADKSFNSIWASTLAPNGQVDAVPENNGYSTWTAPSVGGALTVATVGVNAGVYTRIRDAVRHLVISGINANVNVNIFQGVYMENLNLPSIWAASGNERITFGAVAGNPVEITSKIHGTFTTIYDPLEWPYLVNLNGISNVTFQNITFRADPTSYTQELIISNRPMNNVIFDGCSFIGTGVNNQAGFAMEFFTGTRNGLIVRNSTFSNNYVGIFSSSPGSGTQVLNNQITAGNAVLVDDGTAQLVQGNQVVIPSTLNTTGAGIYVRSNGVTVRNNIVDASNARFGARGIQNITDVNSTANIINNMVTVAGSSAGQAGMFESNSGGTANYYHNTVHMVTTAGSNGSWAMYVSNSNTNPLLGTLLVNNIFHNHGQGSNGGYAIQTQGSDATALRVSDFNNLATTGANLAAYAGVNRTNIAAWRAASSRDQNSASIPVTFVGGADLHLLTIQQGLWGSSTITPIVPTDIDGDTRRKPYMGADEIVPTIQIVVQPVSRYACLGESFTFVCIANVTPGATVKYQWFKDGKELAGRTSAILAIGNVGYPSAGVYTCTIEGSDGTTTVTRVSDAASLFVVRRTEITMQPASRPVALGSTVDISVAVEAVGAPQDYVPVYQWKKRFWNSNTNSYQDTLVVDNGRITGAKSSMLTIRDVMTMDTLDQYFCTVTGYCGTVDSKTARLFIPRVFASNTTPAACINTTIVLECAALPSSLAGATVGYQWYKDGNMVMDDSRISGAMSKVLMINGATDVLDNGEYMCVCTYNPAGADIASNTVNVAVGTSPVIVQQPVGDTLCEGNSLTLSARGTGTAISYQWVKGGAVLPDATGAALTVQNVSAADAGSYSVRIVNSCGVVTSSVVDVLVNVKPVITQAPSDRAVIEGDEIRLQVTATGSGTLTYAWMKGTTTIANATGSTFTVPSATGNDQGDYRVIVSNECGSDTSDVARVGVTVGVTGDVVENGYVLGLAHPNPSTDIVSFNYAVPATQRVRIALTDVLGRHLAQLVDATVDATVNHRVEFSASGLNLMPGVYLFTINTAGFTATQTVILVK